MSTTELVFWFLALTTVLSAVGVVFLRDVTRMVLCLGLFLLSVAGWFLYFAQPFLAVAQVFVYVGGVLVLVLFAIMLLHRGEDGSTALESRHSIDSAMVALGLFFIVAMTFTDVASTLAASPVPMPAEAIGEKLLGGMLPHFEALAVLLLAALTSIMAISGGERE